MARPTKKNDEMKLKLADFIRSGLTVKDACEANNISTSTFNRWRNDDIEFNKLIDEATRKGWENAEAFAKYHYRGYKRKVAPKTLKLPSNAEESPVEPSNGLKKHILKDAGNTQYQYRVGLPVRFTYPTERPSGFYVNGNNGMVERFTKEGILQTMRLDTYERKYLGKTDNICFGIIV